MNECSVATVAVFGSGVGIRIDRGNACAGLLVDGERDWQKVGAAPPDGAYALFRSDSRVIELVTDVLGSRTIWYVRTDDLFIASTSQRAIIFLLGSFHSNEAVYPWVLSSGTLGPGYSWDSRLRALPADGRLVYDTRSGTLKVHKQPVLFQVEKLPDAEHERRIQISLQETFGAIQFDYRKWLLALSGGVDSRAILLLLNPRNGLRTVTWGLGHSLTQPGTDALIARQVARHFGLDNEYLAVDLLSENPEMVFRRHIEIGEGRSDCMFAYLDGFAAWKRLAEAGYEGIIRGDQAFGCKAVCNASNVYRNIGMLTFSDYRADTLADTLRRAYEQSRPEYLERSPGETLENWRDRVHVEFEQPYKIAALNSVRARYMEVANPLVCRYLMEQIRRLPSRLRTDKRLFSRLVTKMGPAIPLARAPATATRHQALRCNPVVRMLLHNLDAPCAQAILPAAVRRSVHDELVRAQTCSLRPTVRTPLAVRSMVPRFARRWRKLRQTGPSISPHDLAYRTFIICQALSVFEDDATTGAAELARIRV